MKRIEILDKAAETGARFKDIDINPTFGAAYFYSVDAGNELINFAESSGITTSTQSLKTASASELPSSPLAQPSQVLSQQSQSFRNADARLTDLPKSTAATTT